LETDAPYLSPVPHRGKRNESGYIPLIAAKVADILGISLPELARLTSDNASEVFRKKG
jgi:TatD DNase family protein